MVPNIPLDTTTSYFHVVYNNSLKHDFTWRALFFQLQVFSRTKMDKKRILFFFVEYKCFHVNVRFVITYWLRVYDTCGVSERLSCCQMKCSLSSSFRTQPVKDEGILVLCKLDQLESLQAARFRLMTDIV